MSDEPRGLTTEELRARVLAHEAETTAWRVRMLAQAERDMDLVLGRPPTKEAPMRYCVNATLTVPAYIYVEADSEEAALEEAREYPANAYETDMGAAEVEFNVTPPAEAVTA